MHAMRALANLAVDVNRLPMWTDKAARRNIIAGSLSGQAAAVRLPALKTLVNLAVSPAIMRPMFEDKAAMGGVIGGLAWDEPDAVREQAFMALFILTVDDGNKESLWNVPAAREAVLVGASAGEPMQVRLWAASTCANLSCAAPLRPLLVAAGVRNLLHAVVDDANLREPAEAADRAHAFARNHVPRALYHHLLGVKPPMARLVGPWTETPRAHEVPRPPKEHDSTHDRRSKAGTGGSWGALKHVLGRKRKPHGSSARTSYSEV